MPPIAFLIENTNVKSADYDELRRLARPGHADYAAHCKYHGRQDYRGGGHFSGRVTAALVAMAAYGLTEIPSEGGYAAVSDFISATACIVIALALMYSFGCKRGRR